MVQSKEGWHVVRHGSRRPGALAKFENVREEATKIWYTEETRKQAWEAVSRLQGRLSSTVRIVTAMRHLAVALLVFARAGPATPTVFAHEATLGVLEFREVRPGAFVGLWTMEPAIGAARVDLRVPPHCFLRLPELELRRQGADRADHASPISAPTCRRS